MLNPANHKIDLRYRNQKEFGVTNRFDVDLWIGAGIEIDKLVFGITDEEGIIDLFNGSDLFVKHKQAQLQLIMCLRPINKYTPTFAINKVTI